MVCTITLELSVLKYFLNVFFFLHCVHENTRQISSFQVFFLFKAPFLTKTVVDRISDQGFPILFLC